MANINKVYDGNLIPSAKALAYAKEKLTNIAPNGCELKVGDVVRWENDYGVKWVHSIIGFDGSDAHLSTDSYWFPHPVDTLMSCDASLLGEVE
jgi:plastocyanin